jgi:adenosine deaminase
MNEQSLAFARAMPKISLHLHLTGAVEASTVADLASKYDEPLPGGRTAERL